jgi:HlyD family secretion protein
MVRKSSLRRDTWTMSTDMDRLLNIPWWRRRSTIIAAACGLVLVFGGAAATVAVSNARSTLVVPVTSVRIDKAERGVFRDFSPIRATVAPRDVITLDAGEGGQVAEVLARPGDVVAAGQPLVRFRNTDLEMQVLERQASLISQISGLQASIKSLEDTRTANARESARIDYEITKLTTAFEQQEALFLKEFTSAAARNRARDDLAYARAQKPLQAEISARAEIQRAQRLPEIEAEIAMLRQTLAVTRDKLSGLAVKAPTAGRLAEFTLTVGETKAKAQAIGKLTAATGFKLVAPIDPYYLGRVRVGQPAIVTLPALDGAKSLSARVSRVDPQVKDGVFNIELEFAGSLPVQPLEGQALEGRLALGDDKPAVVVAAGPWLDVTGGDWAMVMHQDGKTADKRRIKIGRRSAEQVEVLADLRAGESIIVSSYDAFEKIERVQLSK